MADAAPAVRALVLDAVGTVIEPDPPVAIAYSDWGRRHGVPLSPDEIARRFRSALGRWQSGAGTARGDPLAVTSERRERYRWRRLVGEVFAELDEPRLSPLFDSLWGHFGEARHWRLCEPLEPVLEACRRRRVRLAMASNFDARLLRIVRDVPALRCLDQVFVSSQVGYAKPSRWFYERIRLRLELPAAALLMVGDDPLRDVSAPRGAGWQAVHLCRQGRRSPRAIGSLAELPDRLSNRAGAPIGGTGAGDQRGG